MLLIYNVQLKGANDTSLKVCVQKGFEQLFDCIQLIDFQRIDYYLQPRFIPNLHWNSAKKWNHILNLWIQNESTKKHLVNTLFQGHKIVQINFHHSRYEQKLFMTFVVEQDAWKGQLKELFRTNENYVDSVIKCKNNFLRGNQYVTFPLESGREYYTVANPVIVFTNSEFKNISYYGCKKVEAEDFTLICGEDYLHLNNLMQLRNYIKIHFFCFVASDEGICKRIDDFIAIAESEYLAIIRMNCYQDEAKRDLTLLKTFGKIIEVVLCLWMRIIPSIFTWGQKTYSLFYRSIIYGLIEINHIIGIYSTNIISNIEERIDEYESRYIRIRLSFERIDTGTVTHYFDEFYEKLCFPIKKDLKQIEKFRSKLNDLSFYGTQLKESTTIQENYKLQKKVFILSFIVFIWGVVGLGYDKIFYIEPAMQVKENIFHNIPYNLFIISGGLISLSCIIFYIISKTSIYSYPVHKYRKLIQRIEQQSDMDESQIEEIVSVVVSDIEKYRNVYLGTKGKIISWKKFRSILHLISINYFLMVFINSVDLADKHRGRLFAGLELLKQI